MSDSNDDCNTNTKRSRSPISQVFSANKVQTERITKNYNNSTFPTEDVNKPSLNYLKLFSSVKNDKTDSLSQLETENIDKIFHPTYNYPLIHWAAMWGAQKCLIYLLKTVDPNNYNTRNSYTACHLAAARNRVNCLEILISNGATIAFPDRFGRTPLHLAAAHNASHCLEILINSGAEIESVDTNLWTAVHHAAYHGRLGCLETLVRLGARTNVVDKEGNTPAHLAAMEGHLETLKFLMFNAEREIDQVYDALNDYGQTISFIAAQYYKNLVVNYLTDFEQNVLLYETRMDLNYPAHVAAFRGDLEALERLVVGGVVNVNQRDKNGYTLVHKAALKGNIKVITWLEEKGAFLDVYTKEEETVDDIALRRGHTDLLEHLEKRRIELNLRDEGTTVVTSSDGVSAVKLLGEQLTSAQTRAKERLAVLQKEIEITKSNLKQLRAPEFKDTEAEERRELLKKIDELNEMLKLDRYKREHLEKTVTDQRGAITKLEMELKNVINEAEEKAQFAIAYLPKQSMSIFGKQVSLREMKTSEGGVLLKKRTNSM